MNEGSSEASAEVAIHKLATLFRIEKLDRRFSDYTSEKRAFETDQNERPRRYVKKKITGFTAEMDTRMLSLVNRFGESSWNRISKELGKSEIKCHKRYLELSGRSDMVGAPWSKAEDELLRDIVMAEGAKNWTKVAGELPGRIGK